VLIFTIDPRRHVKTPSRQKGQMLPAAAQSLTLFLPFVYR
jgi:hypothetical protein